MIALLVNPNTWLAERLIRNAQEAAPIGLDDRNYFPGVLRLRPNRISPVVSKTQDLQRA